MMAPILANAHVNHGDVDYRAYPAINPGLQHRNQSYSTPGPDSFDMREPRQQSVLDGTDGHFSAYSHESPHVSATPYHVQAEPHNYNFPYNGTNEFNTPHHRYPLYNAPQYQSHHTYGFESALPPMLGTPISAPAPTPIPADTTKGQTADKSFVCTKCAAIFDDKTAYGTHLQDMHNLWVCTYPGCRKTSPFSRGDSYRRHMSKVHSIIIETRTQQRRREKGRGDGHPGRGR